MEGDGPIDGSSVNIKLALIGTNALAVDIVVAKLIGLDLET